MTFRERWQRVTRAKPCPICERPDWCLLAADGGAAICARVESAKRCGEAGWLHRLQSGPWRPPRRLVRPVALSRSNAPRGDLVPLAARWQKNVDPGELHQLSLCLGLSAASLCELGIGWSVDDRAWSFPMVNADGDVLGIRLRRPNGFKFSVTGGKDGLFVPRSDVSLDDSRLLVCEGLTDCAALLDMGFQNVVGRPSCTGGVRLVVELIRRRRRLDVVIVADADEPGRRGADNLASVLLAYAPSVRVIPPPIGIKDARDWLRAGGARQDVEQTIGAAPVRRLGIRTQAVKHG